MKTLSVLFLTALVFAYCGDKAEKSTETTAGNTDTASNAATIIDTTDYLPVAHLLVADTRSVETSGAGILKKYKVGTQKDSTYLKFADFQLIAGQFMARELDSTFFRDHYTETSMMDETTNMLTFIYTPTDSTVNLRKVIVYIAPSLTTNKVDRIYMETTSIKDGTVIDKKLTWRLGKYFYVATEIQPKNGEARSTLERVIWDPEHYGDN